MGEHQGAGVRECALNELVSDIAVSLRRIANVLERERYPHANAAIGFDAPSFRLAYSNLDSSCQRIAISETAQREPKHPHIAMVAALAVHSGLSLGAGFDTGNQPTRPKGKFALAASTEGRSSACQPGAFATLLPHEAPTPTAPKVETLCF